MSGPREVDVTPPALAALGDAYEFVGRVQVLNKQTAFTVVNQCADG